MKLNGEKWIPQVRRTADLKKKKKIDILQLFSVQYLSTKINQMNCDERRCCFPSLTWWQQGLCMRLMSLGVWEVKSRTVSTNSNTLSCYSSGGRLQVENGALLLPTYFCACLEEKMKIVTWYCLYLRACWIWPVSVWTARARMCVCVCVLTGKHDVRKDVLRLSEVNTAVAFF